MTTALGGLPQLNNRLIKQLGGPMLVMAILSMMVLPLPAFILDVLFTFNIAISVMVLLVALNVRKPLDFSVFPTVLLVTTLLRLALNVASTRVVLLHGHTGPDAAGKVIEAFGHFLVGGNTAVGLVVFTILVVINFVVVTKGAGRIAEVGARFTLDAMPGKQMAIDADMNAGLIGEDEARRRRKEVAHEADFYGAMDGASKFVRGDAIAGILILVINIVGGIVVGVLQHNMSLDAAGKQYTLMTVGDGLVAQIPALIISVAAGLVVSRVGEDQDVGQQVSSQMFTNPMMLFLTAAIVGVMGLIPGMPNFVFLLIAAGLVWMGRRILARQKVERVPVAPPVAASTEPVDASWSDVVPVDLIGLEVGYRLVSLVDKGQGGELLRRICGLRKKFAQDIGFLPAAVHIRDNLDLRPGGYRITLKGVEIGSGEAFPGQYLAINPGQVAGPLTGKETRDPTFNLPAFWIDAAQRDHAHALGYTVVDASTVISTHINHLIRGHATELLGRQEAQALIDHIAKDAPKLVEDLVPKQLSLTVFQKVLQYLIAEDVAIRDIRSIVETLAEHAPRTQDPLELTAQVRIALGRAITRQLMGKDNLLRVIALQPDMERILRQALGGNAADSVVLEPGMADILLRQSVAAAEQMDEQGLPAVVLVPDALRWPLSRFLRRVTPDLKVLSNAEIPDSCQIKVDRLIGGNQA